jgi:PAS domain S-box-containing protein
MSLSSKSVHRPPTGRRLLAIATIAAAILVPVAGLLVFGLRAEARARAGLAKSLNAGGERRAAAVSRWAEVVRNGQVVARAANRSSSPDSVNSPRGIIRTTIVAWSAVTVAALAAAAALLWQRIRHDRATARQQRRTGTIFDHASDPILLISPDGRVAHANRRADEFYGYGAGGLVGRSMVDDLVSSEDRAVLRERLAIAAASGEMITEASHRRAGGTLAPAEMSVRRLTFDNETFLVTVVRDLTARRNLESALRRNESLFRTVFHRSPIGILMGRLDGHITRANPAVEEMLGYSAAELTTMTFDDLIAPEDRGRNESAIESELASYPNGYRVERRYRKKDGLITWGEVTVTFVRDESDEASFALVLVQDITERRQLHDQLLQAQKMESIGRLAGGVAHDFNNLLTAILGYAEVLDEEVRGNAQARAFVGEIQHAGSRAATLTAQLLAFARRQVVTRRVLDLNEIVEDVGRMLQRLLGKGIKTELRLAPGLWNVDADPNQLQQIIVNMAVNARDAMPRGGRLIIETANETLEETRARVDVLCGDYVRLTISDNGEGMGPDVVAHIFEPFFTTKEQGKGTGLGLAMCHGIVTQSGGQIRVMTERGRGTTFHVYLPKARRTQTATRRAAMAAPAADAGHLVLLAEDETQVRTLAARVLKRRGFRVIEAQDGGEALRLAKAHADEIDLLLTDVTMPVLDGRELAERFRHVCPGAKILFMSGHPESVIAHQGVLDPGVAYVAKPFTPDQISSRVRDILADL